MQYYITINGRTVGPMSAQQLMYYDIDSNTPVSRDGSDWAPMFTYPELMELYNRHRGRVSAGTDGVSQRLLCGLLAIFSRVSRHTVLCGRQDHRRHTYHPALAGDLRRMEHHHPHPGNTDVMHE